MSAFPFTVGDRVRLAVWPESDHVTITAVGRENFLGECDGDERDYPQAYNWFRYGPVSKEAAA